MQAYTCKPMSKLLENRATPTCVATAELGAEWFAFKEVFRRVIILIDLLQVYRVRPAPINRDTVSPRRRSGNTQASNSSSI